MQMSCVGSLHQRRLHSAGIRLAAQGRPALQRHSGTCRAQPSPDKSAVPSNERSGSGTEAQASDDAWKEPLSKGQFFGSYLQLGVWIVVLSTAAFTGFQKVRHAPAALARVCRGSPHRLQACIWCKIWVSTRRTHSDSKRMFDLKRGLRSAYKLRAHVGSPFVGNCSVRCFAWAPT